MTREDRLMGILDLLGGVGKIGVDEIVDTFGVSPATARRDLDALAERQLLARTRGGASAQSLAYDLPLRYKREQHAAAKERIAEAAQRLIAPGARIGLSGGTTTTAIAQRLAIRTDLDDGSGQSTVVTNAINIATQLAIRQHLRVVVTGGVLHANSYELAGPFSDRTLEQVVLDVAFIGVNGIDATHGPMVHDEQEARVNGLMASRAAAAWLVADASKIGTRAFAPIVQRSAFRGIITDASLSDMQRRELDALEMETIIA